MYTQGKSMKQFKFSPEEYNKNFLLRLGHEKQFFIPSLKLVFFSHPEEYSFATKLSGIKFYFFQFCNVKKLSSKCQIKQ
jgi:hypothetical protein